jgi:LPS-assembly lipoprotein
MALPRRCALVLLALPLASATLAGCGFKLRASQDLPFKTIAVTPEKSAGVAGDLARYLGDIVRPVAPGTGGELPEVILDILQEVREKLVVGVNASGQVREFELRLRVNFQLRTSKGAELITASVIEQHRSISFNESAVLAKEAEEVLLYRDMQADVVQQLLRRLAAVKMAGAVQPSAPVPASLPAPE